MPPGPGVDAVGRSVIDPTVNVRDLVASAVSRLDDLREAENKATRRITHAETKHIRDTANLRAEHYRELRVAEAGRIDAILVNVADTAKLTSAAAEIRATTLANQVTTSADTLRNQVADAAQASNDTLDRRFDPIQKSIEEIRRFQFETQGGKLGIVETRGESRASLSQVIAIAVAFILLSELALAIFIAVHK
jgi:hypothetical protein